MAEKKESYSVSGRELYIERTFNAPRDLVWQVWTHQEHIKNWWGPDGFTNTIFTMDIRPGGIWEFVMHGPDGTDFLNKNRFTQVIKPELIAFEHINEPKHLTTINFIGAGEKTIIRWHMLFESEEEFEYVIKMHKADKGLEQNMEKMEHYIGRIKSNQS
jgi:uncharacterized protein YndB with AHSA1/START domain